MVYPKSEQLSGIGNILYGLKLGQEAPFCQEKYDKPLKAVSSFKSDELIEIADFFKVDKIKDGKKKTKQYLYNELCDIISV